MKAEISIVNYHAGGNLSRIKVIYLFTNFFRCVFIQGSARLTITEIKWNWIMQNSKANEEERLADNKKVHYTAAEWSLCGFDLPNYRFALHAEDAKIPKTIYLCSLLLFH